MPWCTFENKKLKIFCVIGSLSWLEKWLCDGDFNFRIFFQSLKRNMLIEVYGVDTFWSMRKNYKWKNKISKNLHILQTPFFYIKFSVINYQPIWNILLIDRSNQLRYFYETYKIWRKSFWIRLFCQK